MSSNIQKSLVNSGLITVLSDGLGSGVKANIQASMCATMALEFTRENMGDAAFSRDYHAGPAGMSGKKNKLRGLLL